MERELTPQQQLGHARITGLFLGFLLGMVVSGFMAWSTKVAVIVFVRSAR